MNIELLTAFSKLISTQQIRENENARTTHSNFNVFTTLLHAHDEVRLHTRFIHNLLNPHGSHDCGNMFLNLFFETLKKTPPIQENFSPDQNTPKFNLQDNYRIYKEASTKHGQIDLLLESKHLGIAIENKIYAQEGKRQLKRYSEYLVSKYKENHVLFFLTLDGKHALSHDSAAYFRISYREHILRWLEKCLQATYSIIPINQILLQYRHVVRQLTGETIEKKAMQPITDYLIANPELIRMREALNQGIEAVKPHALDLFGQSLIDAIPSEYRAIFRPGMVENSFGKDPWGSIRLSPENGVFAGKSYQIVIEHVSIWNGLMIGIESKRNNSELTKQDQRLLKKLNELLEEECKESMGNIIHKANPQCTSPEEYWPVGWHNLVHPRFITDDVIADLLVDQKRATMAQKEISKALIHIKRFERLHVKAAACLNMEN